MSKAALNVGLYRGDWRFKYLVVIRNPAKVALSKVPWRRGGGTCAVCAFPASCVASACGLRVQPSCVLSFSHRTSAGAVRATYTF